jgi:hypothetical protein
MTQDAATTSDIYPDRDAAETNAIVDRLKGIFRSHPADPTDPHHVCECGWQGESYEDHLARATLTEMQTRGYEFWPARHV